MRSMGVVFGRCGFGLERGAMPNLRCGLFRLWWSQQSIFERLSALHVALGEARRMLEGMGRE